MSTTRGQKDPNSNVRSLPVQTPWWKELDPVLKALTIIVTVFVAGTAVAAILGFGGASKAAVATHEEKIKKLDSDVDLLWETQVRLVERVEHVHEEQRATREDFRAVFPNRLGPLPDERATPLAMPDRNPVDTPTPIP